MGRRSDHPASARPRSRPSLEPERYHSPTVLPAPFPDVRPPQAVLSRGRAVELARLLAWVLALLFCVTVWACLAVALVVLAP